MGVYNSIILDVACPACGKQVELTVQTKLATSAGGDERGRFCLRDYRLGEEMWWWPKGHKRYDEWHGDGIFAVPTEGDVDFDVCSENCPACGVELNALIEFHGPRPVKVLWVRLNDDLSPIGSANTILVEAQCPGCKRDVTLRCHTQAAEGEGDAAHGRFNFHEYRLGEAMRWWPRGHPDYATWRVNGRIGGPTDGDVDYECCFAVCPACRDQLYAMIEFNGPRPVVLHEVGFRWEWPAAYRSDRLR